MKKSRLLLAASIACATLVAFSCTNKTEGGQEEEKQEEQGAEQNEESNLENVVYKFVASPLKGKWEIGDKIFVHGSFGLNTVDAEITAETVLSEDGKVASMKLGTVAENPAEPDGLYAVYPADAAKHLKGMLKASTTFSDCSGLRCAAYLKDSTFTFVDASATISFSAAGYDSFAFCTNELDGLSGMQMVVEYTSEKSSFTTKDGDGYPYLEGSIDSEGKAKIWLPAGVKLNGGYTIFLGKDGTWPKIYKSGTTATLEAGKNVDLGDISSSLADYSGKAPKLPRITGSKVFEVVFNELSGVYPTGDGQSLWVVGDDGDLAKISLTGEVLYKFHIGGDAEDVCIDPETGNLLIGWEDCTNGQGVAMVEAPDFNKRAKALFTIPEASGYGNAGIEGLTYYKDGLVFAGSQSNSHLFLCDLNAKKVVWQKKLYDRNRVNEIAGLYYDKYTDWLWIITSEPAKGGKVFVYDIDVTVTDGVYDVAMNYLGAYLVAAAQNSESVCIDRDNNCMWVGDDYGSTSYIYRYDMTGLKDFDIE